MFFLHFCLAFVGLACQTGSPKKGYKSPSSSPGTFGGPKTTLADLEVGKSFRWDIFWGAKIGRNLKTSGFPQKPSNQFGMKISKNVFVVTLCFFDMAA